MKAEIHLMTTKLKETENKLRALDQEFDREIKAKSLKEFYSLKVKNKKIADKKTTILEKDDQKKSKIKHL